MSSRGNLRSISRKMVLSGTTTPVSGGLTAVVRDQSTGTPSRIYSSDVNPQVISVNGEITTEEDGTVSFYARSGRNYSITVYSPNGDEISDSHDLQPGDRYDLGDITALGSGGVAPSDASPTVKGVLRLAGDLGGTALSPAVSKIGGISLPSGAPTSGQVLTALSPTTTSWSSPLPSSASGPVGVNANRQLVDSVGVLDLSSQAASLNSVVYDSGTGKVSSFTLNGLPYTVTYPSSTQMVVSRAGLTRTVTLDAQGRILSVA